MQSTTNSPDPTAVSPDAKAASAPFPWLASYPPEQRWDLDFEGRPLGWMFDEAVARFADRPCTNFLGCTRSFREIADMAERVAHGLQGIGVTKGTKVGLLLPNCPSFIVYFYGVLKAGGTVVNCNPLYTVPELQNQVADSRTEILVTLDVASLFRKAEALLEAGDLRHVIVSPLTAQMPRLKGLFLRTFKRKTLADPPASPQAAKIIAEADLIQTGNGFQIPQIDPYQDIAVLQYTGGTTGTPKGAMLTHANLSINVQQVCAWAANMTEGEERIIGILPLFHVFAMTTVMNYGLRMGAEMYLVPRFELGAALKLIQRARATIVPGVPTLYNAICKHPKIRSYDLSSIKFCISGGAALPQEIKRSFEQLTGCTLVEGYGLSETSPVATCNPPQGPLRHGSIGLPLPGTRISIRCLDDPRKEMPAGENGEICIAGPQVMRGYWQRDDETADAFTGEFFRTGDVGYMDAGGFVFVVDRLKDMINCSGFKVYPRRVEEAIYAHPAVAEVTVVGIDDAYRGEAPKAFVKLCGDETLSTGELLTFLEDKLSKIEMPAEIEFRDELPRTIIGKLSKKELRDEEQADEPSRASESARSPSAA